MIVSPCRDRGKRRSRKVCATRRATPPSLARRVDISPTTIVHALSAWGGRLHSRGGNWRGGDAVSPRAAFSFRTPAARENADTSLLVDLGGLHRCDASARFFGVVG